MARLRLGLGSVSFEANPFSPLRVDERHFANRVLAGGDELAERVAGTRTALGGALDAMVAAGHRPVPLFAANGGAGGLLADDLFRRLLERLLTALRAAGPLDGIVLCLHGALQTEREEDGEGELLTAVRAAAPGVPVVVTLDSHANVTQRMLAHCDLALGYQRYPHDDAADRGARASGLLARIARGEVRPTMAMRRARMLVPAHRGVTLPGHPFAPVRELVERVEGEAGVLAASWFACFSKFDGADVGFRGVVATDGDTALADAHALAVARAGWARRHELLVELEEPEAAIAARRAAAGPIVLVDAGDCVGGGAAGDSPAVLRALLAQAPDVASCTAVVDASAVARARELGPGGASRFMLGGAVSGELSGAPVTVEAVVERLSHGAFSYAGGPVDGLRASAGPSAVLRAGGIRVLVDSRPVYEYGPERYHAAGVDTADMVFVAAKVAGNAAGGYPAARELVWLRTPGPAALDHTMLPWRRIQRPLFPWDDDFEPAVE